MTDRHLQEETFSRVVPNLQLTWSASSLEDFMACPRKYQLKKLLGHSKGGDATLFGSFYHGALEQFDREILAGADVEAATVVAVRAALELSAGWNSLDTARTRHTLVRAVVWYCEGAADDYVQPVRFDTGEPAVEIKFAVPLAETSMGGEEFALRGWLDGIVKFDGYWVRERKTTKSALSTYYWNRFEPNVQISTYNMVAPLAFPDHKIKGVIVEACQTGVGFTRFGRKTFPKHQDLRDEFLEEVVYWVRRAEDCAVTEHWPKNESACQMYGGCMFREVCSRAPMMREKFLDANFEGESDEQPS